MKFIKNTVPDIWVISPTDDFIITSIQYLDEQDDRVYLKCAEYVPQFKKGYVCDLKFTYKVGDNISNESDVHTDLIKDLILVYVNKTFDLEYLPQYEYIFYK